MTRQTVFLLFGYAVFMVVLAAVFSAAWHYWPQAPDIFYRPWQLSVCLFVVLSASFALGIPKKESDGYANLRRYITGAAVRGAGVLAAILIPVYLLSDNQIDKVVLALCAMGLYMASMVFYLIAVYRDAGRREKGA